MSAHTPGPWMVVHENVAKEINCFEVANVSHFRVILDGGGWPAITGVPEDDARLIAAAPDLLAALKMGYADTMDYIRLNKLGGEDNRWLVMARAAIAKAEGKTA